ncbi:PstS family phosphate ABC transporter substrate-binding protein [Streptomyces hainanensis]|uniref:PstS family phosphate ABC transporter substrate-binding protein n=1 Tax=Streptomyces hainanensis TaxID=402648 RepID=UPI0014047F56|nr:substrate-binding domain-containing protein [Streptomyces hainanensis]
MNVNSVRRAAVALAGAAAIAVGVLAAPAQADPSDFRGLVGVGSDTTQDVLQGLSDVVIDPDADPSLFLIGSYHATGPSPIQTRPDTWPNDCTIARPNGSSAGIDALINDIAQGTDCVDFARSSRGPSTAGTNLTFVPFAIDGVTWAVRSDSPLAGTNLTRQQLSDIYNCRTTQVGGTTVNPLVPQAGSGTRTYWLTELQVPSGALPSCVHDVDTAGQQVQEHDGSALRGAGDIMPYSIAQYIAQANSASTGVEDRRGAAALQQVNGVAPRTAQGTLNTAFPITRSVYNVFETARLGEFEIDDAFVGSGSQVCADAGARSTIQRYGFALNANCGATNVTGNR